MAKTNTETQNQKRMDYISWEDYFMGIAVLSGQRSKDPVTQVGACIVNEAKRIVGIGYNGMPDRCSDDDFDWGKDKNLDLHERKHGYVCHAEMNAIINRNSASLKDCTIYVSLFPCNECAKMIIQSGIKKVVYSDKKKGTPETKAAKKMFKAADILYKKCKPSTPKLVIDLVPNDTAKAAKKEKKNCTKSSKDL